MNTLDTVRVWRGPDHGPYPGIRHGNAVAYEFIVEPRWTRTGQPTLQRSFLLLDEGVDLAQPVGFTLEQADWWYVDLVRFEIDGTDIRRYDMYVDLVLGPPAQPYSVLDLEEFGAALREGTISVDDAADVLNNAQRFIDRRLNRHHDAVSSRWPDFPPRELKPILVAAIPPLASI